MDDHQYPSYATTEPFNKTWEMIREHREIRGNVFKSKARPPAREHHRVLTCDRYGHIIIEEDSEDLKQRNKSEENLLSLSKLHPEKLN